MAGYCSRYYLLTPYHLIIGSLLTICVYFFSVDVVRKHEMRFHTGIINNNVHWESLPSTNDLLTTISRRYSHAACYHGILKTRYISIESSD